MVVKLVSDLCLREAGRGFIISLKASNHYSKMYLDALEQTLALASLNAEEQGWPPVAGHHHGPRRGIPYVSADPSPVVR